MSGRRRRGGDEFADDYADERPWAADEGARGESRHGRRSPLDLPRQAGPQDSQPSRSMGYDPGEDRYALRPSAPGPSRDRERPAHGPAPGGRFPAGRPRRQDPEPLPPAGNRYREDSGPYPPADPYSAGPDERAGRRRRGEDTPDRRAPSSEPPGRYGTGRYQPDRYETARYESDRGYADPLGDRTQRRPAGSRRGPEPADPYGSPRDPRDGYSEDPRGGYGQSSTRRGDGTAGPDDLAGPAPRRGATPDPYGGPRDGYPDPRAPGGGQPDRYAEPDDPAGAGPGFVPGLGDRGDGYTPRNVEYYEEPGGGRGAVGGDGPPGRRRRGRWAGPSAALIVMLIVLVPLAVGGFFAYRAIESHYNPPNYSGAGTGQIIFEVKPGDNATTVGNRLVTDGVVASARALELAAEHSTNSAPLEPGFYRLHKHMNATLAWNLLLSPSARVQNAVTIPEGYRVSQILATLAKESGISAKDFNKAIRNTAALRLPSYAKGNPEGYLFPATYQIQPNMTATQVLQQMVTAYNNEAASVNLPQAAAHDHLTEAEVITVASLAQAEGGRVSDFPKITRVIYNRLNQHMALDLDSTVMFALNTYGIAATDQQLRVNSPYNTYTHQGLPPGPIDSPGNAAIEAALHPASGNWLYFVTVNPKTGQTDFTNSVTVFNQLRAELQANLAHGG